MRFDLPECDEVFMTYFDRWYQPEDRKRKAFAATRPDVVGSDRLKGLSPRDVSPLTVSAQGETKRMVDGMLAAARGDWPDFLSVTAPIDLHWIDEFDRFHDEGCISQLMKSSNPEDFSNDLIVRCCEFGAVIGHVLLASRSNLHWVYSRPYWESSVFDPQTGHLFAVFHWAIKKFSNYGVHDGYKAKLLACSNLIERERQRQTSEQ